MQGANLAALRARAQAALWVRPVADKINEQAQKALCNIKNAFKQEVYTRERRPVEEGALVQGQANEWIVQGVDVGRGPVNLRQPPQVATVREIKCRRHGDTRARPRRPATKDEMVGLPGGWWSTRW